MVEADFRAEMRRIDVPTLIVQGDRDRSVPVELTGKPSAELIPGSGLLVYPGAPHGLMFTHMESSTPTSWPSCVSERTPLGRGLIRRQ